MSVTILTFTSSDIEQGTIGSSGDSPSSNDVRSIGYISFNGDDTTQLTISATSTTGKLIEVDLLGYTSDSTVSPVFDKYWYDSPYNPESSIFADVHYLRFVLRYDDRSTLIPSEVDVCTIVYNDAFDMTDDGKLFATRSMPVLQTDLVQPYPWYILHYQNDVGVYSYMAEPILQYTMSKPYPDYAWRVDESNNGSPYTGLMPNVIYIFPPPPEPPVPPTPDVPMLPLVQPTATVEITDQTSVEYRRYMNGYTNPNLYRFRDGELPENTECDVFIKGTHSHRYTSINDYEDFSTECEIP